jgi:hypothetical protein
MSAWRSGAWRQGAWRVGSWRDMQGGVGVLVTFFNGVSAARIDGMSKLNYALTLTGDDVYSVQESSGVSQDIPSSTSYEGYEFS